MTKDVAPQIAGHAHKCEARGPARDPPKEIVGCYQRHEKKERQPYAAAHGARRQPVDKKFDAVLCADRTSNSYNNRGQDNDMRCKPPTEIAQHECERAIRVSLKIVHATCKTRWRKTIIFTRTHSTRSVRQRRFELPVVLRSLRNNFAVSVGRKSERL